MAVSIIICFIICFFDFCFIYNWAKRKKLNLWLVLTSHIAPIAACLYAIIFYILHILQIWDLQNPNNPNNPNNLINIFLIVVGYIFWIVVGSIYFTIVASTLLTIFVSIKKTRFVWIPVTLSALFISAYILVTFMGIMLSGATV
jgi:hypothetical protein